MTIQEIIQQAQALSITDQVHLVSQLMQQIERTLQPETGPQAPAEIPAPRTAAVGIIAELIKNPIPFDGPPLTRDEIYDR